MKKYAWWLLGVFILVGVAFYSLGIYSQRQEPRGLTAEGMLTACPDSPNCVSSEAGEIEPLVFSGTPEAAWGRVRLTIDSLGGTVEQEEGGYLAATFRSGIFRFVDDMEFRMVPEQQIIHLRSGSRVGHSDTGANKKRVEKLRELFEVNQ